MHKFILRPLVACTAFALSLGLTSLTKLSGAHDLPIPPVEVQRIQQPTLSEDELQLLEIYREYGRAQTRHDRAFFERVETDTFILFLGEENLSREQDIRLMETSPRDIVYDNDVEYIKIFGDTAVAQGRIEARYSDGQVENWGFVDIWIKQDNTWQIQSTTSID